jgi:hypothetical protein
MGKWWISLSPVPKGTHLGCLKKEINHSRMVFTSYFFGTLQIQAKAKQVLNNFKDLNDMPLKGGWFKITSYLY